MKANEAPERIYCESDGLGNIVKVHNIKWPDDEAENIEYTRTNAFIEKAETYLKEQFAKDVSVLAGGEVRINFETAINNFINYMKGE